MQVTLEVSLTTVSAECYAQLFSCEECCTGVFRDMPASSPLLSSAVPCRLHWYISDENTNYTHRTSRMTLQRLRHNIRPLSTSLKNEHFCPALWNRLPTDVQMLLLSFLDSNTLCDSVSLVSRSLAQLAFPPFKVLVNKCVRLIEMLIMFL